MINFRCRRIGLKTQNSQGACNNKVSEQTGKGSKKHIEQIGAESIRVSDRVGMFRNCKRVH